MQAFGDEIMRVPLTRPQRKEHPGYPASPNEILEADFSAQEIRADLQTLKTKSASGADRITN
ncbi:hypothetical protein HPB50_001825 [Hyalomma asiaticum]|uniref:Uncharacterized protein n=1 Tax=Hyalomma asiaticum TaxID=266040 RepID=A0ACB7SLV6_HYAAI|nr:hypothetical protein HPB50_001825 [Hyalomma asiaticum]